METTIRKCSAFTFPEIKEIMEDYKQQAQDVVLIDCTSIQTSSLTLVECRCLAADFFGSPTRAVLIADSALTFGISRMIAGHAKNDNVHVCKSVDDAYNICNQISR